MVAFNKFFASALFLAIVYASSGLAAPWPASLKHATNRLRIAAAGYNSTPSIPSLRTRYRAPTSKRAEASIEDRALAFIQAHLDVPADAVSFKCSCAGEVSDHVFVRQAIDGIPVANALTNVAFNKDDKVVVFGSSFVPTSTPSPPFPGASLTCPSRTSPPRPHRLPRGRNCVGRADDRRDLQRAPAHARVPSARSRFVRLTHVMQIQNAETNAWLEAFVDAHTGDVLSLTDFVTKTSLGPRRAYPSPDIFPILFLIGLVCSGNNAISFKGAQTATTAQSAAGLVFNYPQSATTAPTTTANINARVNAFHIVNSYGFTEAAFNFQVGTPPGLKTP
ncbi:hypothetical protein B0H14DRAFT_3625527 [Mycena olivaceomarginata]|nr:hypothetical protein B0H14DRAFT_3625527 [Mycena olivaceomarginata]